MGRGTVGPGLRVAAASLWLAALALGAAAGTAHAQAAEDVTPRTPAQPPPDTQVDLFDVARRLLRKTPQGQAIQQAWDPRKLMLAVLPTVGYKPSTGFTIGATSNLAKYFGDPETTRISSAVVGLSFSTKKQTSFTMRFGVSGKDNRWRLDGDNRFQWSSQDSYGLGTETSPEDGVNTKFTYIRIFDTAWYQLRKNIYAGAGFHYGVHQKIRPGEEADPAWDDSAYVAYSAENGFDPQAIYDAYSARVCDAIFDPLYTYDYFARPARLVPNTADGLPVIGDGGRTYTIKVRRGIHFAPHPAFGNAKRELTAEDYVYSIKRILDPQVRSYSLYLLENRLVGLDPVLAEARRAGRLDYAAPIEGLKALDRYTLQVKFREPNWSFQHLLTTTAFAAVAREVVAAKGDGSGRVMEDPVGTGPYRLAEWRRSQRIVLEANPAFRDVRFPAPPAGNAADAQVARGLTGRRLPLSPRIEIAIIEEAQPRLLAFRRGELDYVDVPSSLAETVLDGANLKPELAKAGVRLHRQVEPALAFTFFNMEDPVVGGYTPEKIALRRAITMANDRREYVRVLANGQAELATQMIPPPVPGHSPALAIKDPFDPAAARALLDRFGYRDRDGDGFRELPDGKPLALVMGSATSGRDRARDELWKKSMTRIGIRIDFLVQKWPDLLKMGRAGKLQMWPVGWITAYGEGDAFMQLLYSGNIGQSNYSRFRNDEYDELYRQTKRRPAGPERTALYRKMSELVNAYNPWDLGVWRIENTLVRPWVEGYKKHAFHEHAWKFYDLDRERRRTAAKR